MSSILISGSNKGVRNATVHLHKLSRRHYLWTQYLPLLADVERFLKPFGKAVTPEMIVQLSLADVKMLPNKPETMEKAA